MRFYTERGLRDENVLATIADIFPGFTIIRTQRPCGKTTIRTSNGVAIPTRVRVCLELLHCDHPPIIMCVIVCRGSPCRESAGLWFAWVAEPLIDESHTPCRRIDYSTMKKPIILAEHYIMFLEIDSLLVRNYLGNLTTGIIVNVKAHMALAIVGINIHLDITAVILHDIVTADIDATIVTCSLLNRILNRVVRRLEITHNSSSFFCTGQGLSLGVNQKLSDFALAGNMISFVASAPFNTSACDLRSIRSPTSNPGA